MKKQYVYFIFARVIGRIKIGMSGEPYHRFATLQSGASEKLEMLLSYECDDMRREERILHESFAKHRVFGEWFNADGSIINYVEMKSKDPGVRPPPPTMQPISDADREEELRRLDAMAEKFAEIGRKAEQDKIEKRNERREELIRWPPAEVLELGERVRQRIREQVEQARRRVQTDDTGRPVDGS